jgi:glycerol-3-phosphate dehydrogenase
VDSPAHDPFATSDDVDYLLEHAARCLSRAPSRADVRSAFAGLRPLPAAKGRTANVRRDHRLEVADGLVTITAGKWTTYRLMARDAIDATGLTARGGASTGPATMNTPPPENARLEARILSGEPCDDGDGNEIARLARDEMALSVEDVLARRTRALFLDAKRTADAAPFVANVLARVRGRDAAWIEAQVAAFTSLAARYLPA